MAGRKTPGTLAASNLGRPSPAGPSEGEDDTGADLCLIVPKQIPASWTAIAAEMFVNVAWHEPRRWGAALKPLVERHGISRVLWVVASYAGSGMRDIDARRYTPHRLATEWADHTPDSWAAVGLPDLSTPFSDARHNLFVRERILDCRPELIRAIGRLSDAQRVAQRDARAKAAAAQVPAAPAIGGVLS